MRSLLPKLAEEIAANRLTREEADALVVQAIERFGPKETLDMAGGWARQTIAPQDLGTSNAGKMLETWRVGNLRRAREVLRSVTDAAGEQRLIQRTGTPKFASDLDMSLLGPASSRNRELAWQYLTGRFGKDRAGLHNLLYMDLFTDPTRMHLADLLPTACPRAGRPGRHGI